MYGSGSTEPMNHVPYLRAVLVRAHFVHNNDPKQGKELTDFGFKAVGALYFNCFCFFPLSLRNPARGVSLDPKPGFFLA